MTIDSDCKSTEHKNISFTIKP